MRNSEEDSIHDRKDQNTPRLGVKTPSETTRSE